MTQRVSLKNHSLAFGLKQSAVPLTTLAAGLSIPLIALTLGWRWAFVVAAGMTALLILDFSSFGPHRLPTGTRRTVTKVPLNSELKRFFRTLSGVTALGAGGATILASYGVISAVDRGIAVGSAGFLLSTASAIGAFMRIGVGAAAGRAGRETLKMIAGMQLVGGIGIFIMVANNRFRPGLILAAPSDHFWLAPGMRLGATKLSGSSAHRCLLSPVFSPSCSPDDRVRQHRHWE